MMVNKKGDQVGKVMGILLLTIFLIYGLNYLFVAKKGMIEASDVFTVEGFSKMIGVPIVSKDVKTYDSLSELDQDFLNQARNFVTDIFSSNDIVISKDTRFNKFKYFTSGYTLEFIDDGVGLKVNIITTSGVKYPFISYQQNDFQFLKNKHIAIPNQRTTDNSGSVSGKKIYYKYLSGYLWILKEYNLKDEYILKNTNRQPENKLINEMMETYTHDSNKIVDEIIIVEKFRLHFKSIDSYASIVPQNKDKFPDIADEELLFHPPAISAAGISPVTFTELFYTQSFLNLNSANIDLLANDLNVNLQGSQIYVYLPNFRVDYNYRFNTIGTPLTYILTDQRYTQYKGIWPEVWQIP